MWDVRERGTALIQNSRNAFRITPGSSERVPVNDIWKLQVAENPFSAM
jgi:hypothetical protein